MSRPGSGKSAGSLSETRSVDLIYTDTEPTPEPNEREQETWARRANGAAGAKGMLAVQESRSMHFDDSYQEQAWAGVGAGSTFASGQATRKAPCDSTPTQGPTMSASAIAVAPRSPSQHFSFWSDREVSKPKIQDMVRQSSSARYPNPFAAPKRAASPLGSPTGPRVPGAIAVAAGPWAAQQPRNSLIHSLEKFSTAHPSQWEERLERQEMGTTRACTTASAPFNVSMPASLSGDFDQDGTQRGGPPLARFQNTNPRWAPSKDTTYATNVVPSAIPEEHEAETECSPLRRARSSEDWVDQGPRSEYASGEPYCVELETMVFSNSVRSSPKCRVPILGELTSAGRTRKSVSQMSPRSSREARLGYLGGASALGDSVGLARVSFGGGGGEGKENLRTNSSRGGGKLNYVYSKEDTAEGQRQLLQTQREREREQKLSTQARAAKVCVPSVCLCVPSVSLCVSNVSHVCHVCMCGIQICRCLCVSVCLCVLMCLTCLSTYASNTRRALFKRGIPAKRNGPLAQAIRHQTLKSISLKVASRI